MRKEIAGPVSAALIGLALANFGIAVSAAEPEWIYPTIQGFGKAVSLPQTGMQPSKDVDYKVMFNLAASGDADKVNPTLDKVARAVNIFTSAGIPMSHLHFVAVVQGPATAAVLDDEHYRDKFSVANPNTKLIDALAAAGVKLVVCGQALAHNNFPHGWVNLKVGHPVGHLGHRHPRTRGLRFRSDVRPGCGE